MSRCKFSNQISAFYDEELSSPQREMIERHLQSCASCAEELADLQAISAAMISRTPAGLSQIARHRLHFNIDRLMQRSTARLPWSLSGVAAAVLVGGLIWLNQVNPQQQAQAAPPWQAALAVTPVSNSDNASAEPVTPAEQEYLTDASSRNDLLP